MKEVSAELIIRRGRQPDGQHKLIEIRYDKSNFNRTFSKCWFQNFDIVLARDCGIMMSQTGEITNARKALLYRSTRFVAIITDLKQPYIVYFKYIFLCQVKTSTRGKF